MNEAELLRQAARELERVSLVRGKYVVYAPGLRQEVVTGYCSVGALRQAAFGKVDVCHTVESDPTYRACMRLLAESMSEQFGGCGCGAPQTGSIDGSMEYHTITCINDEKATKQDVIACMEKAAVNADGPHV